MISERKNLKGCFFLSFDEKFPALSPPQTWMQYLCLRLAEVANYRIYGIWRAAAQYFEVIGQEMWKSIVLEPDMQNSQGRILFPMGVFIVR